MKLFDRLDVNNNDQVSSREFYDFMKKQFMSPQLEDVDRMIQEYDSTMNQLLDFEEFSQFVLPSTNPNMREIAVSRRYAPQFKTMVNIPYEVLSLFTRLIDIEMQLNRTRT